MTGTSFFAASFVTGLCCAVAVALTGCAGPTPPAPLAPHWAADSATVRVVAGPQYDRSRTWRFFFGAHYRALWATPVTVPVLRLATASPGGLTPLQIGGSYQSHTLRLRAPNGREFVLRSVDKNASVALPAGWKRALLGGLLRDQTSAAQPFGAFVAARLAQSAGVYHTNPRLVYVPNDPGLGKFRAAYANALYLFEERATGDQREVASFGHSPAAVSTAHMLADICRRPNARAVARAYLRARLLDMLLGDWSRREDQWRWASFPLARSVSYRPVPRDRDQAFFLFDDGLVTRLVSWVVPKYQSFHSNIRPGSVEGLTITARALDRTLLSPLSAEDFRQEADSLRTRLSTAAVAQALAAGPAETRAVIAATLGPMLNARRDQLAAVARRYYEILAEEAWVVGTDQAERFVISEAGPGRMRVRMLARRPGAPDSVLLDRTYSDRDTHRVDVFGLAGDDVFELRGSLPSGFAVRVYDGAGRDQLTSDVGGARGDFTWYAGPDGDARNCPIGTTVEADPHPELTADGPGWMRRYNLND